MIKVIERHSYVPHRWRITCPRCGTVFEIDKEDWNEPDDAHFAPYYKYTSCPECDYKIYENMEEVRVI